MHGACGDDDNAHGARMTPLAATWAASMEGGGAAVDHEAVLDRIAERLRLANAELRAGAESSADDRRSESSLQHELRRNGLARRGPSALSGDNDAALASSFASLAGDPMDSIFSVQNNWRLLSEAEQRSALGDYLRITYGSRCADDAECDRLVGEIQALLADRAHRDLECVRWNGVLIMDVPPLKLARAARARTAGSALAASAPVATFDQKVVDALRRAAEAEADEAEDDDHNHTAAAAKKAPRRRAGGGGRRQGASTTLQAMQQQMRRAKAEMGSTLRGGGGGGSDWR
jgi:hypothetical protein